MTDEALLARARAVAVNWPVEIVEARVLTNFLTEENTWRIDWRYAGDARLFGCLMPPDAEAFDTLLGLQLAHWQVELAHWQVNA